VRPKWLGAKLSWESGFIAFLIFTLMATYLASFFVADAAPRRAFSVDSHPGPVHLPAHRPAHQAPAPGAEPATVFLSRGSFAQIPHSAAMRTSPVAGTDLTGS